MDEKVGPPVTLQPTVVGELAPVTVLGTVKISVVDWPGHTTVGYMFQLPVCANVELAYNIKMLESM